MDIKRYVETTFGYDLSRTVAAVRTTYAFDVSCQGSVPESSISFLEADDYEQAVRNAVSLGGDADTMACIAGGMAEAYFGGVPESILQKTLGMLDDPSDEVSQIGLRSDTTPGGCVFVAGQRAATHGGLPLVLLGLWLLARRKRRTP